MARGLKISHKRADNTLVDQEVFDPQVSGSTIGSTGGRPQWITTTGVKTVKVQFRDSAGILHSNAYIIAQKGSTTFFVANAVGAVENHTHSNASATICTIAAGADAATAAGATGRASGAFGAAATTTATATATAFALGWCWRMNDFTSGYTTSRQRRPAKIP